MRRRWLLAGAAALAGCSLLPQTALCAAARLAARCAARTRRRRRTRAAAFCWCASVRAGPGLEVRGPAMAAARRQRACGLLRAMGGAAGAGGGGRPATMACRFRAVQGSGGAGQPAERRFRPGGRTRRVHRRSERRRGPRGAGAGPAGSAARARPRCCCSGPRSAEVRLAGSDPPAIAEAMKAALVGGAAADRGGRRERSPVDAGIRGSASLRVRSASWAGVSVCGPSASCGGRFGQDGRDRASSRPRRDCACSRAAARAAARPGGSSSCPDPAARSSSPCRTPPNRPHRTGCAGSRRCCRC